MVGQQPKKFSITQVRQE